MDQLQNENQDLEKITLDPPEFEFEPNHRYDVVVLDVADNKVAFVIIENEEEYKKTTSNESIVKIAADLKTKGIIGNGKDLPVTIVTFGTPDNMRFKFSTFTGMV